MERTRKIFTGVCFRLGQVGKRWKTKLLLVFVIFFMEAYKYALFFKNIKSDTLFIKIIGYKKLRSIIE